MEDWKRSFIAIWAAEVLALAAFNTSIPIIPFYLQELGVRDQSLLNLWVGVCQTAAGAMLAVFSPIWGRLSDVYGRRPMLLRSMFGGMAVIALMGFASAPWHLAVLRGMQGMLTGTIAAATVLIVTIVPEKRAGTMLGFLQTAVYAGSALGPLMGGVISDLFGHRVTFFVTAVMLLASALIVVFFVKDDFKPARISGSLLRNVLPDFRPLARSRELLGLLLITGFMQVAVGIVAPILPLFIESLTPNAALVASTTGVILSLTSLSAALASAALGRISDRFGHTRILMICLVGSCLLYLPQAFVRTPVQLLVLRMLTAAFLGGTSPSVNALVAARTSKDQRGTIFGLSSSINSTGMAVSPMLGSLIATLSGYPGVFLATAAGLMAVIAWAGTVLKGPRKGGAA